MIKVSAIVSLYNSMEFIEGLMEDLIQQSLFKKGLLEIILVDSSSPQNEHEVVAKYQEKYPNIVYHRTQERETLYGAWNTGIKLAKGDYLTNANSDDRHHPLCLEILAKALDRHPTIDLAYADVYESTVANEPFLANSGLVKYQYSEYFAPASLLFYQFGCQPVWRKKIHGEIGMLDATFKAAGDFEFNLRFALAGLRAIRIPQILGSFLNRPTSLSAQNNRSSLEQEELYKKYLTIPNILKLYEIEGLDVSTPHGQARALTDFARRAANTPLPWQPGESFFYPKAMLISTLGLVNLYENNPRALWNFGIALLCAHKNEEGADYIKKAMKIPDPHVTEAYNTFLKKANHAPFVNI